MISASEALRRLQEGNRRYASDVGGHGIVSTKARRKQLATGQAPFAVILGCSDSRVPVEIIFDQGPGDLFVIRVAGNIVAPSQAGSVEFAAEQLGTRLVVVMGHTMCGAVMATLEELRCPAASRSPNLRSIVDRIRPSVETLFNTELRQSRDALLRQSIRANIDKSVNCLRHKSQILAQLIEEDGLLIVGAEYSLETGLVDFFDD